MVVNYFHTFPKTYFQKLATSKMELLPTIFNSCAASHCHKELSTMWQGYWIPSVLYSWKIHSNRIIKLSRVVYFLKFFNPIKDGSFQVCSRIGGEGKKSPLPKICHIYPTKMKLGRVIPYLKKTQKKYKSRDAHLKFCWYQHFFIEQQQVLQSQKIQI